MAGVQGLKTRLSKQLIRIHYWPSPGDYLAVDFDLLSVPEVPLWLTPSSIPGPMLQGMYDLQVWLKVSKGKLSLEICQAVSLQRAVTWHFWKECGLRKPGENSIGTCGRKHRQWGAGEWERGILELSTRKSKAWAEWSETGLESKKSISVQLDLHVSNRLKCIKQHSN